MSGAGRRAFICSPMLTEHCQVLELGLKSECSILLGQAHLATVFYLSPQPPLPSNTKGSLPVARQG